MTDMTIRDYNPETDYPDVERNLKEAKLFDPDRDTEDRLRKYSERAPETIVVAAQAIGTRVVGSIYVVDGIMPMLMHLVVAEDMRNQGIGSSLLLEGESRLREMGHADIELFANIDTPKLMSWYQDRGYNFGGSYASLFKVFKPNVD